MLSLTTFNPWNDLAVLHRDLDAFFDPRFASFVPQRDTVAKAETFTPAAEIVKDGDRWMVSMYIPGVDAGSIDIEVVGHTLRVRGERPREMNVVPYVCEIPYGRFEREFALTADIDADHVEASYRNGVLELTLPVKESAKPRRIAIATDGGRKQLTAA
jgi:HSP20 family protein